MNNKKISRLLSLVLRHRPEVLGITLDKQAWASTQEIIDAMNKKGMAVNLDIIKDVVANNDKQRFKLSEDATRIRANQGHSIPVDLGLEIVEPPVVLYHGTATKNMASIRKHGLLKRKRTHVHLSPDKETALKVGQRHGKAVVLVINTFKMNRAGIDFYRSENGVWLTDFVAPEYIN